MPEQPITITITPEQLSNLTGQPLEAITTAIVTDDGGVDAAKAFELLSKGVNGKIKKRGEDQYQAAWKARSQSLESVIKEKFGITEFENAENALEAAAAMLEESRKVGAGKFDPTKLTPEQLAGIPAFTELTKKLNEDLASARADAERAKEEFNNFQVMNLTRAKLSSFLDQKQAAFGAVGKDKAMDLLFKDLTSDGYKFASDNNNPVILDKDGKPLLDEYHNPIPFEKVIEVRWPFGFNAAPAATNPNPPAKDGGTGAQGGNGGKYAGWSIDKLNEAAKDPHTPTSELAQIMGAIAEKQRSNK